MKYFDWKIKKEHHIMKEFTKFLEKISKVEEIQKIIPWRISRQQKWTSQQKISFSYFTISWLKLKLKKWATAQEIFIVCNDSDKTKIKEKINKIIISLNKEHNR